LPEALAFLTTSFSLPNRLIASKQALAHEMKKSITCFAR